jgi:putative NADPH-quinone reductase
VYYPSAQGSNKWIDDIFDDGFKLQDGDEFTALHLAEAADHDEIVALLK